ncbi:MAG: redox-sensing transcriptional repressor Rex [Chloroflexi bacterium]|nr:redox-sensing transcriptional repressor Rex [Chloroflexota bacterium]
MDTPGVVIQRLPLYLRCVKALQEQGKRITSSQEMAEHLGLSSAQIRKDLSHFGEFGKQGMGYDLAYLHEQLERILHLDRRWDMVLVGAGDLGHALIRSGDFVQRGFRIVAVFDADPHKIGQPLGPLVVRDVATLSSSIRELGAQIAILAVPAGAAQEVASKLAEAGIRAILNYAPVSLNLPPEVRVGHVDPLVLLQSMTYYLCPEG